MTSIALFHSVLGVRPGINAAADLLRSHGHTVRVVDQYDGRVFDDYDEARAFATKIGYPVLMKAAAHAVEDIPGQFLCAGFSNGGGMSMHVAANNGRKLRAVRLPRTRSFVHRPEPSRRVRPDKHVAALESNH